MSKVIGTGPPVSPKQPQPERLRDWYPYYAGFSGSFVEATLDRHFVGSGSLLDPWNGSGTTTAVAASRGLTFSGLDINPAVTIVARARLTPLSVRASLGPLADEVILAARRAKGLQYPGDPIETWFRAPAATELRRLQRGISVVLVGEDDLEREMRDKPGAVSDSIPLLAAFFYAALFSTTRDLLQRFRGTNPSWIRHPESHRHRINPTFDSIATVFKHRVSYLSERLIVPDDSIGAGHSVTTGSVLDLDAIDAYDACLTSPPYATRVDYVRSSLAELSVMGVRPEDLDSLRADTIGSPRTRGIQTSDEELLSSLANSIVEEVATHPSHGSSNYYGPWIRHYMSNMERSFERVDRSVAPTGRIGVVVQDSYYKRVHIDLQGVVSETMAALGRRQVTREDHQVRHLFSNINPAARRHLRDRTHCESVLVFT